jgi:hypothetical protein
MAVAAARHRAAAMTFVERLGVSDHENAPSGLKKLIDLINLERNRMIEQRIPDTDEVSFSFA